MLDSADAAAALCWQLPVGVNASGALLIDAIWCNNAETATDVWGAAVIVHVVTASLAKVFTLGTDGGDRRIQCFKGLGCNSQHPRV